MEKSFSLKKKLIMALVSVLVVTFEFTGGKLLVGVVSGDLARALASDAIYLVAFLILVWMYRDVLKADWKVYWKHIWRNLVLALIAWAIIKVGLEGIRWAMTQVGLSVSAVIMPASTSINDIKTIQIVSSLAPLLAPFSEEIMFRGTLFYQWTNSKIAGPIMFIVSSISFGLVHWNSFNGQIISMIPYMFMGAFFAFIYWKSGNIWHNIMAHLFFNSYPILMALYGLFTM